VAAGLLWLSGACVFENHFGGDRGRTPRVRGESSTAWEDRSVSVEERVINIVSEHLAVAKEKLARSTSFIEDIGADSLDIVELIMELEEEFDIQIPDDEAQKIKTVGEAVDYIERELNKK